MSSEPIATSQVDVTSQYVQPVLCGVAQVFFQESIITGALFVLGILINSPAMAIGAVVGSAIGMVTARFMKYDEGLVKAGIYGFNSTLVGIATLFFFQLGPMSLILLLVGCAAAAIVTHFMRRYIPIPTYTSPFIVTTWVLFFLGPALGAIRTPAGEPFVGSGVIEAVANGIGQVMFQGSIWTGLLFLIGIAVNDRQHGIWVLVASIIGMLVAAYGTVGADVFHLEKLAESIRSERIALGLYGYNATLVAIALFLWKKSIIPPLLGIVLSVPMTDFVPALGLPALTAPFVLTTWIVMAFGWFEDKLLSRQTPAAS